MHDKQQIPLEPARTVSTQVRAAQSSHLSIDEQETQTYRAVVPVTVQSQGMDATSPLIIVRNLKKVYPQSTTVRPALRGLSLLVQRGEFVAVTGSSDADKSMLLHILGCLTRPSSGDYWLAGSMVSLLPGDALATLRNQRIGFLFQEPGLLPRLSALKNVALPLLYAGFSEAEQKRRASTALQLVGLGSRLSHTSEQLSPGQQQRVAIARAIVNSPSLLLADEPIGNMDTRSGSEIMAVLQALNRRKLTIVLATHDVDLAAYAKRHIILRDGCVVSDKAVPHPRLALDELAPTVSTLSITKDRETPTPVQIREELV